MTSWIMLCKTSPVTSVAIRIVQTESSRSAVKSVIKRRARQLAAKKSREVQYGSLLDLENLYVGQSDVEQRIYANELFARLSPFAQSIVRWRWLGYSWRKIAEDLDMDHTVVRRAYFREMESLLHALSQPGDSSQCG